jgi:hypothetical protein
MFDGHRGEHANQLRWAGNGRTSGVWSARMRPCTDRLAASAINFLLIEQRFLIKRS